MSHSIHMLSIQIDTKSLELIVQFSNIKYPLFQVLHCMHLIDCNALFFEQ